MKRKQKIYRLRIKDKMKKRENIENEKKVVKSRLLGIIKRERLRE